MKYSDCRIQVFARAPVAGEVKTRLHPLLGPAGSAELHACLVRHTLEKLANAHLCPLELWCTPGCEHPFFAHCHRDHDLSLHRQPAGDLGERMYGALAAALCHCRAAILVGTDCPALAPEDIDAGCRALQTGSDIVLGPATDGGYYLVGMHTARRALFTGIDWGGSAVLAQTLAQAGKLGLRVKLLERHDDLDTPADYRRLLRAGLLPTQCVVASTGAAGD